MVDSTVVVAVFEIIGVIGVFVSGNVVTGDCVVVIVVRNILFDDISFFS